MLKLATSAIETGFDKVLRSFQENDYLDPDLVPASLSGDNRNALQEIELLAIARAEKKRLERLNKETLDIAAASVQNTAAVFMPTLQVAEKPKQSRRKKRGKKK